VIAGDRRRRAAPMIATHRQKNSQNSRIFFAAMAIEIPLESHSGQDPDFEKVC
jgi:hypothetical protein